MCVATGKPPTLVCTLGDLQPGTEFHTPDGETWMVTSLAKDDDDTIVINLGNARGGYNAFGKNGDEIKGRVTPMRADTKLGYDHKGRFYASSKLNGWQYDPATKEDIVNILAADNAADDSIHIAATRDQFEVDAAEVQARLDADDSIGK